MDKVDKDFYDGLLRLRGSAAYRCVGADRDILYFAGAAEALTGFDATAIIGKSLNSLVHGLNKKKVSEIIDTTSVGGEYYAEYRLVAENGSTVWVSDTGKKHLSDGTTITEGILTDITAVRRVRTSREKFVKNLNREIRTPMSTVIGFLELAIDILDDDEVVAHYLSKARHSAVSMLKMLNDISYISRQTVGLPQENGSPFCARIMLEDMVNYLSEKAAETGTTITLQYDEDSPECFRGDARRLRRIISVLAENSIARSAEGLVFVSASYNGENLVIRLDDSGEKMDKRHLKEFFMPHSESRQSGRNIRMAVAGVLAGQIGGVLRAESTDNGNSLVISVPMTPETCVGGCGGSCLGSDYNPESVKDFSRGLNVLLAEDVEENADLALFRLRRRGHRVDVASDGLDAVKLFTANSYDVVLLDLHMPLMDGFKAIKTIKSMNRGRYVPVIGMTSSPMSRDRQAALDSGMDAVFIKPIDFNLLFEKMEQLVPPEAGFETRIIACVGEEGLDLSPLDGYIDIEEGVRLWGSEVMFVNSLLEFADKYKNCCETIKSLMDSSMRDAYKYTHRLKNITAGFACLTLMHKLGDIESWLYAGDKEVALMMLNELEEEMDIFIKKVSGLNI